MDSIDLDLSSYTDSELRELLTISLAQVDHWNKLFQNTDKITRHRESDRMAFDLLFDQCKKDVVAIEKELKVRGQKVKVVKGSGRKSPELDGSPQQSCGAKPTGLWSVGQISDQASTHETSVDSGTSGRSTALQQQQADSSRSSGTVECTAVDSTDSN